MHFFIHFAVSVLLTMLGAILPICEVFGDWRFAVAINIDTVYQLTKESARIFSGLRNLTGRDLSNFRLLTKNKSLFSRFD